MKTCNLCHGSGSLFVMYKRKGEWYDCPACKGKGCRDTIECSDIVLSKNQNKYLRKVEE